MPVAKMSVVVLDCPEPRALADFYAAVLGGEVQGGSDARWVVLDGHGGTTLAFQRADGFVPPSWPSADRSQQFHLDLTLQKDEIDAAEEQVLALGATPLDTDDNGGKRDFRVYADPAGHPFCLCTE
jgi:catechol 2,3-dioxygenase-like lactoylglutathione lyase family enzyme